MVADADRVSWRPCTSWRSCTANSMSRIPPRPRLSSRSVSPASRAAASAARLHRPDLAHRVGVEDVGPHERARSARRSAAPRSASPATGRALISAWNSHGRRPALVPGLRSSRACASARPARPSGRRSASVRNTMPSAVGSVITREQRRAAALGVGAVAVVHEQHVDVARVVQLGAAELAHPDHGQRHRRCRRSRARRRGTPRASAASSTPTVGRSAMPSRSRPRCAASSRRFQRRSAPRDPAAVRCAERRRRDRREHASTSDGSPTSAVDSERERARDGDRAPSATVGVARRARRARSGRPRRSGPGPRRAVAASAERSERGLDLGVTQRRGPSSSSQCVAARPGRRRAGASYPGRVPRLRVAAAQLNLVVGDLDGNAARILDAYERRRAAGCDLVVFPELAVTGYPPEDLLLKPAFVAAGRRVRSRSSRPAPGAARGGDRLPRARPATSTTRRRCARDGRGARRVPQAAAAELRRLRRAALLRRRRPIRRAAVRHRRASRSRVSICEDAWSPTGPILTQAAGGAELVVNINASPYYAGRLREREAMLADPRRRRVGPDRVREPRRRPGRARVRRRVAVVRRRRRRCSPGPASSPRTCSSSTSTSGPRSAAGRSTPAAGSRRPLPEVAVSDVRLGEPPVAPRVEEPLAPVHEVYEALVLGTRDYVRKNGFTDVLIGLSGGIDSSLVAAVAVDALGPEHVDGVLHAVALLERGQRRPTPTTLAANLGIRTMTVPIEPAHAAFFDDARRAAFGAGRPAWPRRTSRPASAARPHDDLEQVRLDGAHHRQQERDGHRLRDALRRHGRRVRGHQGRAEDARVRAVPGPQRARRPGA